MGTAHSSSPPLMTFALIGALPPAAAALPPSCRRPAAALPPSCRAQVLVLEAHEHAGGCAHEFSIDGFHFENGPSLYAGLSPNRSPNPLKHVFQIIGEEPEWLTYDRWGTAFPEGTFAAAVGAWFFFPANRNT